MQVQSSAGKSRQPVFEGFALQLSRAGEQTLAEEIVKKSLGEGWKVKPFGDERVDFEVLGQRGSLSIETAWERTYRLRAEPGVVYAEPLFAVGVSSPPEVDEPIEPGSAPPAPDRSARPSPWAEGVPPERSGDSSEPLPESRKPDWIFQQMRVYEVWQKYFSDPATQPGHGIIIGHPDTGYSNHPEVIGGLQLADGWDFVGDDNSPLDELERGFLLFPGHGTSTASVIVSPKEAPAGFQNLAVKGIAPGVKMIPLRVSGSVIHVSMLNVANAIERAADRGAHIISMSLGGLFSHRLRKAVAYAQKRGVIVVAAAGNRVRFVVWPAAYEEVIAVAASNARRQPWGGSSRGSAVDVTAPGESVWVAQIGDADEAYLVGQGSGTSFATAAVAALAALWLAHHGRQKLAERYGIEKIPFIFNQILRDTCDPVEWSAGKFGAGIVNAERLLAAPLPDGAERSIGPPAFALEDHAPVDRGGMETFTHLFEQSLPGGSPSRDFGGDRSADATLRAQLAKLLRTTEEHLPARLKEVGQELAFHLATDPALYQGFEDSLLGAALDEGLPERGVGDSVEHVRAGLLVKGVSAALRKKVGGV